jgi:hypothetical protein
MKNLTVNLLGIKLSVDYEYSYDPGVHTYPNGDPGYPPNEEIEIVSITTEGDIQPLLNNYSKTQEIIDKIREKISKFERNG